MANNLKGNDPIGDTPIFDFHDYGRKCRSLISESLSLLFLFFCGLFTF